MSLSISQTRRVVVSAVGLAAIALTATLAGAQAPAPGAKKDEFQTGAPYAILVDANSGTVLFEKAADTPRPPSSLAKLMTAEVVFHEIVEGRLNLEDEFIVSEDAWRRSLRGGQRRRERDRKADGGGDNPPGEADGQRHGESKWDRDQNT